MSYGNITMLGDLPELEDGPPARLEPHIMERPNNQDDNKYQKYIRPSYNMMVNSGMAHYGQPQQVQNIQSPQISIKEEEIYMENPYKHHCIDIAKHIEHCPICSKLYNSDKTLYVVVIVILAIFCLLLLKRVLNV